MGEDREGCPLFYFSRTKGQLSTPSPMKNDNSALTEGLSEGTERLSSRYTVVAGEPVAVFYILGSPASCRVTLSLPLGLPVHS